MEFDLQKFEFEMKDGSKQKLTGKTWTLRKNCTYIQWATTMLSDEFISKLKVGDTVKVYYDGTKIADIVTTQFV